MKLHISTEWMQATPYLRLTFTEQQTYRMTYDLPYPVEKIRRRYPDIIEQEGDAHESFFAGFQIRRDYKFTFHILEMNWKHKAERKLNIKEASSHSSTSNGGDFLKMPSII